MTLSPPAVNPASTASPIRATYLGSWCEFCGMPVRLVAPNRDDGLPSARHAEDGPSRRSTDTQYWEHIDTLETDCEPTRVAVLERVLIDREEDGRA